MCPIALCSAAPWSPLARLHAGRYPRPHMNGSLYRTLSVKDLLNVGDLSTADIESLFATAASVKREPLLHSRALLGMSVILIFEKPSLRTRVSFEVGVNRLGGQGIYFDASGEKIGERETVKDYAKNLERWVHAIVARTYSHQALVGLAQNTRVPVVCALSNDHHPCQALADLFTLREHFGTLKGVRLAYVGDGNNVCHSLMQCATKLGVDVTVIGPEKYWPDEDIAAACKQFARKSGGSLTLTADRAKVKDHDAVYTDAWVSMHQTGEGAARVAALSHYQVNAELMDRTSEHAVFMHCLPAHRGEEVTDEVIDSPESLVYQQAENRMHAQNAVLLHLVASRRETLMKPFPTRAGGDAKAGAVVVRQRKARSKR